MELTWHLNYASSSVKMDSMNKYLSVSETAKALGLCGSRIRQLIADGRLPAARAGRRTWLVERQAVERFLARWPVRAYRRKKI